MGNHAGYYRSATPGIAAGFTSRYCKARSHDPITGIWIRIAGHGVWIAPYWWKRRQHR